MGKEKMDMAKVLAILAQPKEAMPPLENVARKSVEIAYITKDERIENRRINIVMPAYAVQPMPLIYIPHYEMAEDSLEMRDYLAQGWAVACPAQFENNYNGRLTDDDLVFNNAALYTLRHMPEFDLSRIALVGGSAGGYMTLMLHGLQLGICASIANGPVANAYFNFNYYFHKGQALNLQALAKIKAQKEAAGEAAEEKDRKEMTPLDVMKSVMALPIPFLAGVSGLFLPILDNFKAEGDMEKWEALSGVGVAQCFSAPLVVNHNTSDVLVPVDQITKRFTYQTPGETLPADFDMRLPQDFPGKLKCSLEECLPEAETRVELIPVPEVAPDCDMPFDTGKRFNLNIYDDGAPEGYGSHSARMDVGRRFDVPYLKEMLSLGAAKTNVLTPGLLTSFIERYEGKSMNLPAHMGVDDTLYGSLVIYRREICEELAYWIKNNGRKAFDAVVSQVLAESKDSTQVQAVIEQMLAEIAKSKL